MHDNLHLALLGNPQRLGHQGQTYKAGYGGGRVESTVLRDSFQTGNGGAGSVQVRLAPGPVRHPADHGGHETTVPVSHFGQATQRHVSR